MQSPLFLTDEIAHGFSERFKDEIIGDCLLSNASPEQWPPEQCVSIDLSSQAVCSQSTHSTRSYLLCPFLLVVSISNGTAAKVGMAGLHGLRATRNKILINGELIIRLSSIASLWPA